MYFSHQFSPLSRLRVSLLPVLILCLLSSCASLQRSWPRPETPYFHAATPAQAQSRATYWRSKGYIIQSVRGTGSMLPWLTGGELVALEPYGAQLLHPGMVLTFYRGADAPNVIHLVADVTESSVYMTGLANRQSDGWIPKSQIHSIVREIIKAPAPASTAQ